MDIEAMIRYIPLYMKAAKLTITLGGLGIVLSVLVGFACSLIRHYKLPIAKQIVEIYIELSRNTPLLIQLFFLYYGLPKLGIKLSAEACGIAGLTFLGGSYMAEAFRGGFEAVSKTQIESGMSIGLNDWQLVRYVILPQAFAISIPAIGANIIFLLKETSLFSAVALADLMFVAKDLIGMYYKTDEALFLLVIAYLIILLPLSLLFSWIERRVRYAGFGH